MARAGGDGARASAAVGRGHSRVGRGGSRRGVARERGPVDSWARSVVARRLRTRGGDGPTAFGGAGGGCVGQRGVRRGGRVGDGCFVRGTCPVGGRPVGATRLASVGHGRHVARRSVRDAPVRRGSSEAGKRRDAERVSAGERAVDVVERRADVPRVVAWTPRVERIARRPRHRDAGRAPIAVARIGETGRVTKAPHASATRATRLADVVARAFARRRRRARGKESYRRRERYCLPQSHDAVPAGK